MSYNSNLTYKFKPFTFTVQTNNRHEFQAPKCFRQKDTVYSDAYYIEYSINMNDPFRNKVFWKYSFDSKEWKIVLCKNIPQQLEISSIILSGSIIIIIGCINSSPRSLDNNRIYLGNLADEYKECGMKLNKLEVSGDIHIPLNKPCAMMDGQYVYEIGYDDQCMINVGRLDLSIKKWEILDKSTVVRAELYTHKAVFYKGGIYVLCYNDGCYRINMYTPLEIYKFDVVNKKWETLPVDPDSCPSLYYHQSFHSRFDCVQCPEKSNLVYLFNASFGGVWRFNINNLQWEKINWVFPLGLYCLSTSVTNSGQMYCRYKNQRRRLYGAWLTIPKLKVIAWEAMIHYFKKQMFASSDEHLKEIGLPKEFYDRIIEARRVKI